MPKNSEELLEDCGIEELYPEYAEKPLPFLPQTGTCYQDAWRFVIKEGEGYLVHGTVWSSGKRIGHAWVETDTGYIWEPETKKFYTKLGFQDAAAPVGKQRYTPAEASIMAARTNHFGPWSEQDRDSYYRHLADLVNELLPPEADKGGK